MAKPYLLQKYQAQFAEFGDTPKGLFWNDKVTQDLRFNRIYSAIKPYLKDNASICDIGCGTSDFSRYLTEQSQNHTYIGIDIVPEMIDVCKNKYPKHTYYTANFLDLNVNLSADFFVLSGSLNMRDGSNHWEKNCYKTLDKMFQYCSQGIVFNFLTGYSDFYNEELIYFKPEDIFKHCITKMSRFVYVDHAYPLYESTVLVLKQNAIKDTYPHAALKKYFKD